MIFYIIERSGRVQVGDNGDNGDKGEDISSTDRVAENPRLQSENLHSLLRLGPCIVNFCRS